MAKESCRYALSWDIFGGPDSVTLTLTWKLIDDEPLTSIINEATTTTTTSKPSASNYDDPHVRSRSNTKSTNVSQPASSSSPRRSRRDEPPSHDGASVPAIFRSSRGKSLEGSSSQLNKTLVSHPVNHYHHRQKKTTTPTSTSKTLVPTSPHLPAPSVASPSTAAPSDPIYGHLYDTRSAAVVKCATISSLSSSSPSPQPNPPRPVRTTTTTPPTHRQFIRPASSSNYAKLQRMTTNHLARHDDEDEDEDEEKDDDDDETLDPWVKRFECSLEERSSSHPHDETKDLSEEKECSVQRPIPPHSHSHPIHPNETTINDSTLPSGKVKFKSKPDYF